MNELREVLRNSPMTMVNGVSQTHVLPFLPFSLFWFLGPDLSHYRLKVAITVSGLTSAGLSKWVSLKHFFFFYLKQKFSPETPQQNFLVQGKLGSQVSNGKNSWRFIECMHE